MAMQAVISESKSKMQKAVNVLQDDLKAFRGGRATRHSSRHLKVEYYGNPTPLKSLATISARRPTCSSSSPSIPRPSRTSRRRSRAAT